MLYGLLIVFVLGAGGGVLRSADPMTDLLPVFGGLITWVAWYISEGPEQTGRVIWAAVFLAACAFVGWLIGVVSRRRIASG